MFIKKTNLLILIDGNAIAYRSFYAFIKNPLINSYGEHVGAVLGFVKTLNKLIAQIIPTHIACIFDSAAPTFRHKMYKEYKATRTGMPNELLIMLPWIQKMLRGFNIPTIEMSGYEADDIIGTLAKKAAENTYQVGIFTFDKDFYQLINDKIKILHPNTFTWFGKTDVKEKMGVPPERIIDLLALMGDSSDNVPGLPGVGPKTAVKLLNQFDNFDVIMRSADQVTQKKIANSIRENNEIAQLSRKLVTIDIDVSILFDEEVLQLRAPNRDVLLEIFERLELGSLYQKYLTLEPV